MPPFTLRLENNFKMPGMYGTGIAAALLVQISLASISNNISHSDDLCPVWGAHIISTPDYVTNSYDECLRKSRKMARQQIKVAAKSQTRIRTERSMMFSLVKSGSNCFVVADQSEMQVELEFTKPGTTDFESTSVIVTLHQRLESLIPKLVSSSIRLSIQLQLRLREMKCWLLFMDQSLQFTSLLKAPLR